VRPHQLPVPTDRDLLKFVMFSIVTAASYIIRCKKYDFWRMAENGENPAIG
jgi:hypothetical protein